MIWIVLGALIVGVIVIGGLTAMWIQDAAAVVFSVGITAVLVLGSCLIGYGVDQVTK